MASITLKELPDDLHGQLKLEAEANYRSLSQEALARLQRSFEIDAAQRTKRDQALIDEAMASGPEQPLTRAGLDKIRDSVLRAKKT
jgi:plasmid stability protein